MESIEEIKQREAFNESLLDVMAIRYPAPKKTVHRELIEAAIAKIKKRLVVVNDVVEGKSPLLEMIEFRQTAHAKLIALRVEFVDDWTNSALVAFVNEAAIEEKRIQKRIEAYKNYVKYLDERSELTMQLMDLNHEIAILDIKEKR